MGNPKLALVLKSVSHSKNASEAQSAINGQSSCNLKDSSFGLDLLAFFIKARKIMHVGPVARTKKFCPHSVKKCWCEGAAMDNGLQGSRHLSGAKLGMTEMLYDDMFSLTEVALLMLDDCFAVHLFQMAFPFMSVLEAEMFAVDGVVCIGALRRIVNAEVAVGTLLSVGREGRAVTKNNHAWVVW